MSSSEFLLKCVKQVRSCKKIHDLRKANRGAALQTLVFRGNFITDHWIEKTILLSKKNKQKIKLYFFCKM